MQPSEKEIAILAAAEAEFIAHGYNGARMAAIAEEAGVNKALLNYYYRSKTKLYAAVFEQAYKPLRTALAYLEMPQLSRSEQIAGLVQGVWRAGSAYPQRMAFLAMEIGQYHAQGLIDPLVISPLPLRLLAQVLAPFLCFRFFASQFSQDPAELLDQLRSYYEALPAVLIQQGV